MTPSQHFQKRPLSVPFRFNPQRRFLQPPFFEQRPNSGVGPRLVSFIGSSSLLSFARFSHPQTKKGRETSCTLKPFFPTISVFFIPISLSPDLSLSSCLYFSPTTRPPIQNNRSNCFSFESCKTIKVPNRLSSHTC